MKIIFGILLISIIGIIFPNSDILLVDAEKSKVESTNTKVLQSEISSDFIKYDQKSYNNLKNRDFYLMDIPQNYFSPSFQFININDMNYGSIDTFFSPLYYLPNCQTQNCIDMENMINFERDVNIDWVIDNNDIDVDIDVGDDIDVDIDVGNDIDVDIEVDDDYHYYYDDDNDNIIFYNDDCYYYYDDDNDNIIFYEDYNENYPYIYNYESIFPE
ncbi:MAG: hypothetical protein ACPKQO_01605 [Nitrososphaeraceae archaeon]